MKKPLYTILKHNDRWKDIPCIILKMERNDFDKRAKILKNLPRVRIELTAFRFLFHIMRLTRCLLR